MAASFTSTQPGASSDYLRYVYENPVKTDRIGDPDLLDFALAPIDNAFVKLNRGAYITVQNDTYGVWFTGYITNEPEYVYLGGDKNGNSVWGYRYEASSDEAILSEQSLGIVTPFLNLTQGQILKALAQRLLPNWFGTSGIQDGLLLARYQVDPTKKFADIVKEFSDAALYRFYAKSGQLFYEPQDVRSASVTIDPTNKYFSPDQLDIRATKADIVNDAVVIGGIEPQDYVTEYFVGDGETAQFPLMASVFGVESAVLLDETFQGNSLAGGNWTVYDNPSPVLQLSNGFLNVLGGNKSGVLDIHLDSASLIPIEGNLRFTHGDIDFVNAATTTGLLGIIAGLWTQAPNAGLNGCITGIAVYRDAGGNLTLYSVYNGVISSLPFQAVDFTKRYVFRTLLTSNQLMYSTPQAYHYSNGGAHVQSIGSLTFIANNPPPPGAPVGVPASSNLFITHFVSEIDPVFGMLTDKTVYPKHDQGTFTLTKEKQLYALYVPAATSDLHCSITNITVSTPIQATLQVKPRGFGKTYAHKLIGPNEVDALDGQSPVATISQSGGVTKQSSTLGTPQYSAGNPTLQFFKDSVALTSTIPNVADTLQLTYRKAGAAIGRARDNDSVALEGANWGDSGVRSLTKSDANPLPRTSAECESAAAAIVGELGHTRYEGTLKVYSDYTNSEPVAGTILSFQNMPSSFASASFGESLYQVKTTWLSSKPKENFLHEISFGKATDQEQLRKTLSRFQIQTDAFYPQDSAQVPPYVLPSSVGIAYAADVFFLQLLSFDANNFYVTAPFDPPLNGGFEIRSTNDSWGADDGKNLIARVTSRTFTLPRNMHNKVAFVKAYDVRNQLRYSEDLTQPVWSTAGRGMSLAVSNAHKPNGRIGPVGQLTLGNLGSSVITQAVPFASSGTYNCAFSASIKGVKGRTATLRIMDDVSNVWAIKEVTCTGEWQRVTVSGNVGGGVGGWNTGPWNQGGWNASSGTGGATTLYTQVFTEGAVDHPITLTELSFENFTLVETAYIKTSGVAYGANSRYASAIRLNFPLVPPAPKTATAEPAQAGQLVGVDPTVQPGLASSGMLVTPILPDDAQDVWGFEIRDADNATVLYHTDLTSSSYQPTVNLKASNSSQKFYVYCYNLFGEYSTFILADPSLGTPTVTALVVNDVTQLLLWQASHATSFQVLADATDETFSNPTLNVIVTDNFLALQDSDFYPFRWFRVIPRDALGQGAPLDVAHQLAPPAVEQWGSNQVVGISPGPIAHPALPVPPIFKQFTALWVKAASAIYTANKQK